MRVVDTDEHGVIGERFCVCGYFGIPRPRRINIGELGRTWDHNGHNDWRM